MWKRYKRSNFYKPEPFDGDTLKLQIIDIADYHEKYEDEETYVIVIYGITLKGNSVSLKVTGFKPYFYMKVPPSWPDKQIPKILNELNAKLNWKKDKGEPLNPSYYDKDAQSEEIDFFSRNDCKYENAETFRGFKNHAKFKYLKLVFNSANVMRICSYIFSYEIKFPNVNRKAKYEIYENKLIPLLRFLHVTNIEPCGWIEINKQDLKNFEVCDHNFTDDDYIHNPSTINATVKYNKIKIYHTDDSVPFMKVGFDIECTSCDGSFPQAKRPEDKIIQIGATFRRHTEETSFLKTIFTLKKCNDIPDVLVASFDSENDLLLSWAKFMRNMNPDVIYGYNSNGFDWKYIYDRTVKLKIKGEFIRLLSKNAYNGEPLTTFDTKQLKSSGLGDNLLYYYNVPGLINIDIMKVIQSNPGFKLPSYKLNYVLKYFGQELKVDLSPNDIFDKYQHGTPDDIRDIAIYCVRDVEACHDLFDHKKLSILQTNQAMANVSVVPLSYIFLRGQGIKFFSLAAKLCNQLVVKIPTIENKENDPWNCHVCDTENTGKDEKCCNKDCGAKREKFKGAMVIEPVTGIHNEPIAVIDFNSLYPSIMIDYNLSPDTKVERGSKYDNLPDVEYWDLEYYNMDEKKNKSVRFIKKGKNNEYLGIIPRICLQLLDARKKTRAKMKLPDVDKKVIDKLESEQLSYKMTCNSIYGQLGSSFSQLADKEIAAIVTAQGRKLLGIAKQTAEEIFNAKVVYGDSVTGDTPLILKDKNGDLMFKTIETIGEIWSQYEEFKPFDTNRIEKQQSMVDYQIWTSKGWSNIKRVIKHKTTKKIYRVLTHTGVIDVTEDHSLLTKDREIIKPKDCVIGTELLHGYPINNGEKIIDDTLLINDKLNACKSYYLRKQKYNNLCIDDNYIISQKVINDKHKIKKIIDLGYFNGFVYDLETETGDFHAGIGELIVKNTDSIFIKHDLKHIEEKYSDPDECKKQKIMEAKRLSDLCAKLITKTIALDVIAIEYEKVFYPWISLQKKMYVGYKYEFDPTKYKYTEMGVSFKKRDYAPIVSDICEHLTKIILDTGSLEKTIVYLEQRLNDVLDGKEDVDKFVITKALKSTYARPESTPHKQLADRMKKRDPGNAPRPNERLEIIFIDTQLEFKKRTLKSGAVKLGAKIKPPTGTNIEHVDYVKQNNLKIDYAYYITNQLLKSLVGLITPLGENPTKRISKLINTHYFNSLDEETQNYIFNELNVDNLDDILEMKLDNIKKMVYYKENIDSYSPI